MQIISPIDITLIWSFRNRLDILQESLLSAHKTSPIDVPFCLIDAASNDDTIKNLRDFVNHRLDGRLVRVCESSYRTTLWRAWNLGMILSNTRYVAFSSSDVLFNNRGWVEEIIQRFEDGKEYILIENHALFGIDKAIIPKIGFFDENFISGPHADPDYMIRASEKNIKLHISHNIGFYSHSDSLEDTKNRLTKDCKDRLPMNDFHNEEYFMRKWESSWPGWKPSIEKGIYHNLPHPPTHFSQVKRLLPEINPYPLLAEEYRKLYNVR